jgi:hypothetical protein
LRISREVFGGGGGEGIVVENAAKVVMSFFAIIICSRSRLSRFSSRLRMRRSCSDMYPFS